MGYIVALTGGIGSGKKYRCGRVLSFGYHDY